MTAMTKHDGTRDLYLKYAGNPAENYERYFVPDIGRPIAQAVVAAARLQPGDRVLDVACGTGVAARQAAQHVGSRGAVVGIDLNPGMVDVARSNRARGDGIEWHVGAAEKLPFADEAFDAAVSSLGFQFFADKGAALDELRRVLVGHGRVSVGTVGPIPPLFRVIEAILADHLGPAASEFIGAVFSVHDPDSVRGMFDASGFCDIAIDHEQVLLRLAAPVDFVWQYITSTPLAELAATLDEAGRRALERAVAERCESFTDRGSLVMEPHVLVASARRC